MCAILFLFALIGMYVVAKVAFVVFFPLTAARFQARQLIRAADRMLQATLEQAQKHAEQHDQAQR